MNDVIWYVAMVVAKAVHGGVAEDDGRLGEADRRSGGVVAHVGQIDHHTQAVHLTYDFLLAIEYYSNSCKKYLVY